MRPVDGTRAAGWADQTRTAASAQGADEESRMCICVQRGGRDASGRIQGLFRGSASGLRLSTVEWCWSSGLRAAALARSTQAFVKRLRSATMGVTGMNTR